MTNNPYATPESDVEHHSGKVENGSIFWGSGRLSVAAYFGQYQLLSLITIGINFGVILVATGSTNADMSQLGENPLIFGGLLVLSLISAWVGFCLAIKRFHDRNLSGWWVLSLFIIIGMIILLIPGKEEPNRFGAWRQTRMWEKIVLGVSLLLLLTIFVLTTYFAGSSVE